MKKKNNSSSKTGRGTELPVSGNSDTTARKGDRQTGRTRPVFDELIRKPWAQEVAPIIKATAHIRGFATVVARHMSELTGSEVKRQQVACWLHSNPYKRQVPSNDRAIPILEAVRLAREELGL